MSTAQAKANEREAALRQRVRRAEQDRDECLKAAARADRHNGRRDSSTHDVLQTIFALHVLAKP
eukprot:scaffold424487_cov35-Prasinocladus_malaysianus.AAC.1